MNYGDETGRIGCAETVYKFLRSRRLAIYIPGFLVPPFYNPATGALCHDPDGYGGQMQIQIAAFSNRAALHDSAIILI